MNRKLPVKFVWQTFLTIAGVVILSAGVTSCGKRIQAENETPAKSGRVVKELAGVWNKKQAGGSEYARYAENLGNFETYEISADGSLRRLNTIAAKNYDCPIETVSINEGAMVVESETTLKITLEVGTIRHRELCAPARSYTAPIRATTADYQWKIKKAADGETELCLTQTGGETACYLRAE